MRTKTKRTALGLGLLAAMGLAATAIGTRTSLAQGDGLRGVWTAQPSRWNTTDGASAVVVQLSLRRTGPGRDWNSSFPVLLGDLKGLSADQTGGPRTDVRFELARDAGTIGFEGRFEAGDGAGHFTFTSNPDYVQDLRRQGYDGLDEEKVFSLATHDVSRGFIRELGTLGYARVPLDQLLNLRIHGATPEFIRELQALGYAHPDVDELVNLRIHGASAAYIRELKSLGYERVPVDELVDMRIHGVTPDFIRRVNAGKGSPASVDRLVDMRIHGRDQ